MLLRTLGAPKFPCTPPIYSNDPCHVKWYTVNSILIRSLRCKWEKCSLSFGECSGIFYGILYTRSPMVNARNSGNWGFEGFSPQVQGLDMLLPMQYLCRHCLYFFLGQKTPQNLNFRRIWHLPWDLWYIKFHRKYQSTLQRIVNIFPTYT